MIASIVLNDMNRTFYAAYGYRSWMLQDIQQPYEVILNLFNDKEHYFKMLSSGCNSRCTPVIKSYPQPEFFNIAAANNLGLYYANGTYVLFANSDVIYPSNFLREYIRELSMRKICYALGSRVYLNARQTQSLSEPITYTLENNFDFMRGYENLKGRKTGGSSSPWTVLREVAQNIGGFDPQIVCHEDSEFNDRVMHYLRRTGQQHCLYSVVDLFGYHLSHPDSELYDASIQAISILEPRRVRLQSDPGSSEDICPTRLHSLKSLKEDFYKTIPPQGNFKKSVMKSSLMKPLKRSIKILLEGMQV
ncbi:MAG: glycosyltransferase [bacterium]